MISDASCLPKRRPLRPELEGLQAYGAPQDAVPVRLNVNENPFSPPDSVRQAIAAAVAAAAATLNRYPDRDFMELRGVLCEYLAEESGVQLKTEQIWAGNGSNEVMLHLLQAYGGSGRVMVATTPSYSMYPEYARDTGTGFIAVPRFADFSIDEAALIDVIRAKKPSMVVIPSPNNPTGTALPLEQTERLLAACRGSGPIINGETSDTLLVIDEAYAEFRRDGVGSALSLLATNPHLVVTRTMSKAFGAAGLRLGYLAADAELIRELMVVRLPYHISALTQASAIAALRNRGELRKQVQILRAERDRVAAELAEFGFTVAASDANFIMFGVFEDAAAVFSGLRSRGILIRQVGPVGWLRVSIGTPTENDAFLKALAEVTCRV